MIENQFSLFSFYKGWDVYQQLLINSIEPLTPEQLALRAAPHLWSVAQLAEHIISARIGWFHNWMGEGSSDLALISGWEDEEEVRTTAELVAGLKTSWQMIEEALTRWTPADLEPTFKCPYPREEGQPERSPRSRQWIIWHVLEHDIHHGGELSLILGVHGLAALDL